MENPTLIHDTMEAEPFHHIEEITVKCELIEVSDEEVNLKPMVEYTGEDNNVEPEQNAKEKKKRVRIKKPPSKNVPCETCHKTFGSNSQLKKHMLIHTGERPYVCVECGKAYRQAHHLKTHEMAHVGLVKNVTCTECGASFTRKSSLIVHQKIHTGLKPHTCHICSKSFVQKINLVYHIKVHEGDRKFECEECHKKFMTRCKLKEHERKHDKKKLKQNVVLRETQCISEDESPTLVSTSPLWGSTRDDDSVTSILEHHETP